MCKLQLYCVFKKDKYEPWVEVQFIDKYNNVNLLSITINKISQHSMIILCISSP